MSKVSMVKSILNTAEHMLGAEVKVTTSLNATKGGYSRLKGIFRSGQNYKTYDKIVSTAERKIVGNIPKEIINVIVKNHPECKGELIQEVQAAFGRTAETLKLCQIAEIDAVKTLDAETLVKSIVTDNKSLLFANSKDMIDVINTASAELEASLSKIFPKCKVKISHLGEGAFGNGYRVVIVDASGNRVIPDRVLKVFKDTDLSGEFVTESVTKAQELVSAMREDDLFRIVKTVLNERPINSGLSDEQILKRIRDLQSSISSAKPQEAASNMQLWVRNVSHVHGANAEANSVMRLKHILGHDISHTNAVDTDMFDLGSGFSLTRFSDNTLPNITSKINFEQLGLKAGDLHAGNLVNGRIVDFGAITMAEPRLADKTVLKYFKKIINRTNPDERNALIEHYRAMASDPRTPLRDKINVAIDIVESRAQEFVRAKRIGVGNLLELDKLKLEAPQSIDMSVRKPKLHMPEIKAHELRKKRAKIPELHMLHEPGRIKVPSVFKQEVGFPIEKIAKHRPLNPPQFAVKAIKLPKKLEFGKLKIPQEPHQFQA